MVPSGRADVVQQWVGDRSRRWRGVAAAAVSAEGHRTCEGARTRAKVRATTRTKVRASASYASASNGAHVNDSV